MRQGLVLLAVFIIGLGAGAFILTLLGEGDNAGQYARGESYGTNANEQGNKNPWGRGSAQNGPTPSENSLGASEDKGVVSASGAQEDDRYSMYNEGCTGKGNVTFTYAPRKMGDIGFIEPMGLMSGEHVTPIDHQYYYPPNWSNELKAEELKDVFAPADGVVTELQSMPDFFNKAKGTGLGDYRLVIHHTCTFYTIYIHLNQLSQRLQDALGEGTKLGAPVKVKAGELLGRANAFDFSAHNEEVTLKGFVVPEHYRSEAWKIHTVDPFDYFTPEVRAQLLAKNVRSAEPLGGKIDHDSDGTLAGNWFVENTNGYEGIRRPEYWVTHVSFSPDALDPGHFIVSLGDFNGQAKQFGAKGNAPNPTNVSVSSGLVKYELVGFEYFDGSGKRWDRISYARDLKAKNVDFVEGVVLVQLLEGRKLRLEAFPGKKAGDVTGFTANATLYER